MSNADILLNDIKYQINLDMSIFFHDHKFIHHFIIFK